MTAPGRRPPVPTLVGVSDAIREVLDLTDSVAASECPVLIEGESGTGKELVARRLHALSPRRAAPFIPVNCAGVSETLFESQFFGHIRGSFTGAEQTMLGLVRSAEGGVLFLDEIAEMPLALQPKLLRVLQDGEVLPVGGTAPSPVDTRFVAATNRNLLQEVRAGRFREDLFYRLNVVRIRLAPLRERREDVLPLLDHFLDLCAARAERPRALVPADARRRLEAYGWPGNVRELASWVERLYATGLPALALADALVAEAMSPAAATPDAVLSLEGAERQAILRALESAGNNQARAARLLNIHRSTLARKLQQYHVA